MADKTRIEWTDATWNPITGCSVVSPGCTNCYAMRLAGGRLKNHPSRQGLTVESKTGPVWNGEVRFNEQWLDQPLHWRRPRTIFVCAHGDLFHESVPSEWIAQVFAVMCAAHWHKFQVLTKRSKRMRKWISDVKNDASYLTWRHPLFDSEMLDPACATWEGITNHIWLGVSTEDQQRTDERIPDLLGTPAAVRFVSAEPLLGPINFHSSTGGTLWIGGQRGCNGTHAHSGQAGEVIHGLLHHGNPLQQHHHHDDRCGRGLDWIIVGGESGNGARPMHPDWARSIRDQCAAAGVPFFFKQWGEWAPVDIFTDGFDNPGFRYGSFHKTDGAFYERCSCKSGDPEGEMYRVGKRAAGRLLDGVEHNGMPA